ncbi:MAG TPA: AbrB/MazE/SpoVT family DNA-binding domain-containing protein [Acidobacteria bacterium]|nr:AbrB/MazE/SpoVT family DNA-binding domain-containing protein [Acidobacteriota bacterium]
MTRLIRIGNSQGVRIAKPLVEQAGLDRHELELVLVDDGLLIRPIRPVRAGWEEAFREMAAGPGDDPLLDEETPNRFDEDAWEW